MSNEPDRADDPALLIQAAEPRTVLLTGLAITAGTLVAAFVLPAWLPGLSDSLLGPQPKAYWYLSRASGLVAFGLIWLSMVWGVLITNRMARLWPGVATAGDLHQHVSLLGLGFALFHGLILLGDRFAGYSLFQILVPFTASVYRPFWVGLGQVSFYALALVALSFYVRRTLGTRTWRKIHFLSFAVYALALLHGVVSGSETSIPGIRAFYWGSGAILLFLTVYRILLARFPLARKNAAAAPHAR